MITQHRFHSNYQPTKMPHQLSGGTFSHAVQKEEGFVLFFFIQREIFSFPRRRLFTETIPGEGAFDSPSAAKTHTKRKRRKG